MKPTKWIKLESTRYVFSLPIKLKDDASNRMKELGFKDFSRYLRHLLRKDMNLPDVENPRELKGFRNKLYHYIKQSD